MVAVEADHLDGRDPTTDHTSALVEHASIGSAVSLRRPFE